MAKAGTSVCPACKGSKKVGAFDHKHLPPLFAHQFPKGPMQMQKHEAQNVLLGYCGDDAGFMTEMINAFAKLVIEMDCPHCAGIWYIPEGQGTEEGLRCE